MRRELARAARRLADQQSSRLADVPASRGFLATVVAVTAGGSDNGNTLITVRYRGADLPATGFYASYTPTVGDRVDCVLREDQLIVVDKIVT
jgi:hypothetical protein